MCPLSILINGLVRGPLMKCQVLISLGGVASSRAEPVLGKL